MIKYVVIILCCSAIALANNANNANNASNVDVVATERTEKIDTVQMPEVSVTAQRDGRLRITSMDGVDAGVINVARKTELVTVDVRSMNTTTNNARQSFQNVAGLNIWESDVAGLQLGIGGRGLSPDRSSNFTIRQNGYDISADPLGYPESYYSPPFEAIERIEIVRGGGALRYGTQFGGVVNFVFQPPATTSPLQINASLTGGSFGFAGLFAKATGTIGAVGYNALYQGRRADGWRSNSSFDVHTVYADVSIKLSDEVFLRADFTHMNYLAQQPGGLTDVQFDADPQVSVRSRNWFAVDWNVASLRADVVLSSTTMIRSTLFGLFGSRQALGNLDRINMIDLGGPRTLIDGAFQNIGNETTITSDETFFGMPVTLVSGFRLFRGTTQQVQGDASDGSDADFTLTNPNNPEGSDYTFPNDNAAVFAEGVFTVSEKISIVPGVRWEHITTRADGAYRVIVKDLAGNPVVDTTIPETTQRSRSIVLGGLGIQWKASPTMELFANAVQNYRSITFNDLRISNPNLIVDTAITDERGYTLDVGVRGTVGELFSVNASVFYIRYNDRIGEILRDDVPPLYLPFRYRTNVADAFTTGVEAVLDINLAHAIGFTPEDPQLFMMINGSIIHGEYLESKNSSIQGNRVEFVPNYTVRIGLRTEWQRFGLSVLTSFVGEQFSDATNATFTASAVTGLIPAYSVTDVTASYNWNWLECSLNVNNVFNSSYFTRRAASYPGPGIIPAEPMSVFLRIGIQT